jgi:NCS2 family nucleobase:cation symporter-2
LIPPYLIAAVAMALNSMGAVTAAQRTNDADWQRPDMANIGLGVTATALTNIVAALVGGCGQSSSPGAVGLAVATGATSRIIGFGIGALWVALAFSPKLATAMLIMPSAVIGPALIFTSCILVVSGAQAMTSRMLDARKSFAQGIALAFGLSRMADAHYFKSLPDALQPWVSSPLALSVTIVVLLNALFRIGIHQRAKFTIDAANLDVGKLGDFMTEQGRLWGAKPAVIYRATYATNEIVEALTRNDMLTRDGDGHSPIEISTRFDEFTFIVSVFYKGDRLEPRNTQPTPTEIIESEDGARLLAAYMIGKVADKASSTAKQGGHEISVTFNA